MAAYLIANSRITDQGKVDEYLAAVGPTLAGHDFKVLVMTTESAVVEGAGGERTVVMEFPNMAALRAWYDSPAYQEVRELRLAGTDGIGVIVEGM
ncbi:MAG: DUF1330 domain-containing protein [Desertimonas sp.]